MTRKFPKSIRRFGFWLAYRGCCEGQPDMHAAKDDWIHDKSLEGELRIENALELYFFAKEITHD